MYTDLGVMTKFKGFAHEKSTQTLIPTLIT